MIFLVLTNPGGMSLDILVLANPGGMSSRQQTNKITDNLTNKQAYKQTNELVILLGGLRECHALEVAADHDSVDLMITTIGIVGLPVKILVHLRILRRTRKNYISMSVM